MTSPEKILENARREVEQHGRKRYFNLSLCIGLSVIQVGSYTLLLGPLEDYYQSVESFVWGILFGVFFVMLSVPGAMCVASFLHNYSYESTLSRRLIELEEGRLNENKS